MTNPTTPARPLILVIEDDPGVAALEAEVMEELDCDVASAKSGKAALDWLATAPTPPTLMLMDFSLPDMNGSALLDGIAQRGLAQPPFIVATGAGDEYVAVALMRRGALNYLIKDHVFLEVLPTAIQRALGELDMVRRLAAAERRLKLAARVLDGTMEGMYVTDDHHRIIETNPAFERITGFDRSEVLGQSPLLFVAPVPETAHIVELVVPILNEQGHWQGEIPVQRKNGDQIIAWFNISRLDGGVGESVSFVTLFNDITQRKQAQDEIKRLAMHDPLTRLPNRRLFSDRLTQFLARARRAQTALAVLFIDLDKFKPINDVHGHETGDWVLQTVARRIESCLRASDTAARMGGDEFLVLLPDLQNSEDALTVAEKIRQALAQPFVTAGELKLQVSASIGVALYPDHAQTEQDLLRLCDRVMYQAKSVGGNSVQMCQGQGDVVQPT